LVPASVLPGEMTIERVFTAAAACLVGGAVAMVEDVAARRVMGVEAPDAGDVAGDFLMGCGAGGGPPVFPGFGGVPSPVGVG